MGKRQKQHMGRSEGDESQMEGRDFVGEDLPRREAYDVEEQNAREARTHRVVTDHELHPEAPAEAQRAAEEGEGEGGRP